MLKFRRSIQRYIPQFFAALILLISLPFAYAQTGDFSLTASQPVPQAVDPDSDSRVTLTLQTLNGFTGSVTLTCAITSNVTVTTPPTCSISGSTTPPSQPQLSFVTTSSTSPATYTVTITGVSGSLSHSVSVTISVLGGNAPTYQLSIVDALHPSSVASGNGATATIQIAPASGYSGNVTPGCSTITPAVEPSPVCSFNPATIDISDGQIATTTLTITTTNTTITTPTTTVRKGGLSGFLMLFPLVVVAGAGLTVKRRGKLLGIFCLCMVAASLIVLPACNSTSSVNNGSVTPNNTYTFTINAYDQNGFAASNSTALTVSLTVN